MTLDTQENQSCDYCDDHLPSEYVYNIEEPKRWTKDRILVLTSLSAGIVFCIFMGISTKEEIHQATKR